MVKRAPRRISPPSDEELAALLAALPAPLTSYACVAAWSGLRLSEVAALRWSDVRVEPNVHPMLTRYPPAGRLVVRSGKGGKRRESVLLPPGVAALELVRPMVGGELVKPHPESLVFRNTQGRIFTRQTVNKAWIKARADAGLERFVFHDLRKFHASYLLNRGVTPMDVALQLGHFDKHGRPNTQLVEQVYGFVDHDTALDRVAAC